MTRRHIVQLLSAVALVAMLAAAAWASPEFCASRKSNKYHYPSCRWAQKIKPDNLITFDTPEAARRAEITSLARSAARRSRVNRMH